MTARQVYEALLIESNKVQSPAILLEDFNYFVNKTIGQTINKIYNFYDINQQKSDDLRVLKSTAVLTLVPSTSFTSGTLLNQVVETYLPDDYLHILGCIIEYVLDSNYKCYKTGDRVQYNAKRLTADMFPPIINNYYFKPTYKNPYFYINNVNISNTYPTTDTQELVIDPEEPSKLPGRRYGNKSKVRMEVRSGNTNLFMPTLAYVDYLRSPEFIRLTQNQIDEVVDTSQLLEFPDYVCQEIVNELAKLLLENASDPRLQTNIPVNQSIAIPGQQQR